MLLLVEREARFLRSFQIVHRLAAVMEQPPLVPPTRSSSPHSSTTRTDYTPLKQVSEHSCLRTRRNHSTNPQKRSFDASVCFHFGMGEGYLQILSLFSLAVIIACMNHVLFARLDGREPGSHTGQFWVTVLKNIFPTAVAFLLSVALKISLSQVALYHIRLNSHPLALVNLITSLPSLLNTLSILFKSSTRASMVFFALLAIITQAVALSSLFVPGTLTIVPAPSRTQTLAVPNIDFSVVDPVQSTLFANISEDLVFTEPSQRWRQIIMRAASSSTAPAWKPPAGCGSACLYSFSYLAPALTCTQIAKEQIWPTGTNTSDSRLTFPFIQSNSVPAFPFYNSTPSPASSEPNATLSIPDMIYMENFQLKPDNTTLMNDPPVTQWSPRGISCIFQNATYEATTKFLNNTQVSSTRVKEWHGPFPMTSYSSAKVGTNSTNMTMAVFSVTQSFSELLQGYAFYDPSVLVVNASNTQVFYTSLFTMSGYSPSAEFNSGMESAFFHLSLSPAVRGNLSAGLQDLLGNVTLAFVSEQMTTTDADVDVTPDSTQYQYISWRLGLIYAVVFGFSLLVIAYGVFCLRKNGIIAVFDLEHALKMTASSSRLHVVSATAAASHHPSEFGDTLVRVFLVHSDSDDLMTTTRKRIVLNVSD
ncbi:hypothetical protein D9757_002537 [Collybiopsis confluens]|uniref:Transmembrane protein n=1 Tax=Collybiopsis confluens TaxID=2823264 RepID=A0A8H5HYB2_9AGAR|nr:hypothetical protein D9757_002537 [Collybiopsis confluens]